jgi:plastocyanin
MSNRRLRIVTIALALGASALYAPAASAGGGAHCPEGSMSTSTGSQVVMRDACFTSTVTQVDVGESVTFVNQDPFTHNVVGWNGTWGRYDELGQGEGYTHTFARGGVYPYACYLHPGMTGAIVVGKVLPLEEASALGGGSEAGAGSSRDTARAGEPAPVSEDSGPEVAILLALGVLVAVVAVAAYRARAPRAPATPTT